MELRGTDWRQRLLHKDSVRVQHVARGNSHLHVRLKGPDSMGMRGTVSAAHDNVSRLYSILTYFSWQD